MPTGTIPHVLTPSVNYRQISNRPAQSLSLDDEIDLPFEIKKEKLASLIRDKMNAANLKNSDLASKMNKRPSEITRWLSGKHNFSIESIFLLEKALECQIISLSSLEKVRIGNLKKWRATMKGYKTDIPVFLSLSNPTINTQEKKVVKVAIHTQEQV